MDDQELIIEMSNFNPPQEPASSNPSFGSLAQYTDLVLKHSELVVREADKKLEEYFSQGLGVLHLLLQASDSTNSDPWVTWRSWMQRHLIPVLAMCDENHNRDIMEKRLKDLLGYVYLGLELNEFSRHNDYDDAWAAMKNMSSTVKGSDK